MKTNDLKMMTLLLGLTLTSLTPAYAAAKGGDSGGGGDALEGRVNEIRSDLASWIVKGGARELALPADISYGEYFDKMSDILENKKVALGFTNDPVMVNGVEKTCRGYFVVTKKLFSEKKSTPQIICNIRRFKETLEPKQYSLIHHEYAGLVNIEKNDGSASDYEISNQLTDFLEDRIVKKLAVKKKPVPQVEVKRDSTLERVIVKSVDTFKKEERLNECRPFDDQLEKEQLREIDEDTIDMAVHLIKGYYKENGLTKVTDIKLVKKTVTVKQYAEEKTTGIVYHFIINAGVDSTEIKFIESINGEYKKSYKDDISNYVDKLGRIKARELNCIVKNDYLFKSDGERSYNNAPTFKTQFVNVESGYQLKMEDNMSSYFQIVYEKSVSIKKEL